jgi:hypothetical protein
MPQETHTKPTQHAAGFVCCRDFEPFGNCAVVVAHKAQRRLLGAFAGLALGAGLSRSVSVAVHVHCA